MQIERPFLGLGIDAMNGENWGAFPLGGFSIGEWRVAARAVVQLASAHVV